MMCGLSNLTYVGLTRGIHNEEDELGASWHPNYKGHIKVASSVIPYISTITGWEMEEKPYRYYEKDTFIYCDDCSGVECRCKGHKGNSKGY